ncbi:hypothetical protein PAMP_011220 [Pampus punctatissimus]
MDGRKLNTRIDFVRLIHQLHWAVHTTPTQVIVSSGGLPPSSLTPLNMVNKSQEELVAVCIHYAQYQSNYAPMCTYGLINRGSIRSLDAPHVGGTAQPPHYWSCTKASKRISQALPEGLEDTLGYIGSAKEAGQVLWGAAELFHSRQLDGEEREITRRAGSSLEAAGTCEALHRAKWCSCPNNHSRSIKTLTSTVSQTKLCSPGDAHFPLNVESGSGECNLQKCL